MSRVQTTEPMEGIRYSEVLLLLVIVLLVVALPSFAATNQSSDHVYLIEIVDSTGGRTYQTVALEHYHRLRAEAGLRNRFLSKALAQAKDEWKETYTGVSKPFPPNVASTESVTSLGLFTTEDAARSKLQDLRSKAEQRHAADGEKLTALEKQIKALREDLEQLGNPRIYSNSDRDTKIQSQRQTLKILEHDLTEQNAKKARLAADLEEARRLYEKKLTAIMAGVDSPVADKPKTDRSVTNRPSTDRSVANK